MKRLMVTLICLLTLHMGTALAAPGPEPIGDPGWFSLDIRIIGKEPKDVTRFEEVGGWDFGDRSAYGCAWVEFFDPLPGGGDGEKLFEVQYHAVSDYSQGTIKINDSNGVEASDETIHDQCWADDDPRTFVHDGSDHFPHSTSLVFHDLSTGSEIARIDYPNQCTKMYWTPGIQAGEAWLWWDEDGPEDKLDHGDGLCGGGPAEPVALVQAKVRDLTLGIEACTTDAMDGDMCRTGTGQATSVHVSRVTLKLRGSIRATGLVRVPDGTATCESDRVVVVQRRGPNGWKSVGRDRTNDNGRYSKHVRDRDGVYRARALRATRANGVTCNADVSKRRTFRS
jgi:hypothetical protein